MIVFFLSILQGLWSNFGIGVGAVGAHLFSNSILGERKGGFSYHYSL